jgi:GntR family transcriptional regulator
MDFAQALCFNRAMANVSSNTASGKTVVKTNVKTIVKQNRAPGVMQQPAAAKANKADKAERAERASRADKSDANEPIFQPLYQQIKGLILRSLQQGEWKPAELIPSEQELAVRYKVSQGTVRKAIDELAAENLLLRRQGKGTFVATHHEERVQYRFLRLKGDAPEGDDTAEPPTREVLDCRRVRASAEIARMLDLKTGDAVLQIRRLLRFSGKPVVLDDIYLPGGPFKGLSVERLNNYTGPLYALFETEYGTRMIHAEEKLRAVNADESLADLLEVSKGAALLKVERVSFTYGDKPVEVRNGWYVTTDHFYRNELN